MIKRFLITGGAGFIGSAVCRAILNNSEHVVINVDKLTYAGNLESLVSIEKNENYIFEQVDICNKDEIKRIFATYRPDIVMHLAAESHVDNSIESPDALYIPILLEPMYYLSRQENIGLS